MSKEDLLRHANEKRPADFTAEFKSQVSVAVAQKLTAPKQEVAPVEDNAGE